MEIVEKVSELLAKKLKVKKVDPNKEFKELGFDSLDTVSLLLDLEDEFHISFTPDELKKLKKVQDLYNAIEEKAKK